MVRYAFPELAKRQGQSDGVSFRLFRLRLTLPRHEVESVRGNVEAAGGTLEAAVAIAQARLATLCPMGMDEKTWDALSRQTRGEMSALAAIMSAGGSFVLTETDELWSRLYGGRGRPRQ